MANHTTHEGLYAVARAARASQLLLVAAFVCALWYALNAHALWADIDNPILAEGDQRLVRLFAQVFIALSAAAALAGIGAAFKATWGALLLWLPLGLWWLGWGWSALSGRMGDPLIMGGATLAAIIGTRATFRFQRLSRRSTVTGE